MSILMDVHYPSVLNTQLPLVACPSIALVCFFASVSPLILRVFFTAIEELKKTGKFSDMELDTDEDEHSIEMHLPYVRKIFEGYVSLRSASRRS